MTTPPDRLLELARTFDISTSYDDWQGHHVDVPEATIAGILRAMGIDSAAPDALESRQQALWRRALPACLVVTEGDSAALVTHVEEGQDLDVSL